MRLLGSARFASVHLMMVLVIPKMASLTERLQILVSAIHLNVVQVRHGQHDHAVCPLRRPSILFFAATIMMEPAFTPTLTASVAASSNALRDRRPVFRVSTLNERHQSSLYGILAGFTIGSGANVW